MELNFDEVGKGQPLVLIHGFPLDRTLWHPQLAGLSDVARVIAVDLRGFGKSPEASGTVVTMEQHARDIKEMLDGLGIAEAVVCGLSMGGYVALAIAELFPEMLNGIILCNTRAVADGEAAQRMREITALKSLDGGIPELVPGMVEKLLSTRTLQSVPQLSRFVSNMLLEQPATAWATSSRGMAVRPDRTALLGKLHVPALVVTGSEDALMPPAESEAMATHIPHAELVVIPRVGHLSNLEAPDAFNGAVHEFLEHVN